MHIIFALTFVFEMLIFACCQKSVLQFNICVVNLIKMREEFKLNIKPLTHLESSQRFKR